MAEPNADNSEHSEPSSISTTLLERIKAQQPEAWRRLAELYGPIVYGWCRRSGMGPEDAADVVQEVFSAVAANVADFRRDGAGSFSAWLATIARNKICDHFRGLRNRPIARGGTDAQQQLLKIPDPEEISEITQVDEKIVSRRSLEFVRVEFENRTWEAFERTTLDGQSPARVAEELGMSVMAVYKARSRVLRRLRTELDQLFD